MREFILVLVFIISHFMQLNAQGADYQAIYHYKRSDMMAHTYSGVSKVYFNDSLSISEFQIHKQEKNKTVDTGNKVHASVIIPKDVEGRPIYTDISKRIQVFKESFLRNKMIVTDSIIDMNWELLDKREVVNGYNCLMAEGSHAGRNYTSWYTTEIPYPFGPFKFHGLPGLIVKIQSEDKNITMNLRSIKPLDDGQYKISPPENGAKMGWKKYETTMFNYIEEYNASSKNDIKSVKQRIEEGGKYDLLGRYYKNKRN